MRKIDRIQGLLERALAFAHAALEDPSEERVGFARRCARELMPEVTRARRRAMTLGEARQLVLRMRQLRTVMAALERPAAVRNSA